MSKEEILIKLDRDIQRLERRLETAINFGWGAKGEIVVTELNYFKAIKSLIKSQPEITEKESGQIKKESCEEGK